MKNLSINVNFKFLNIGQFSQVRQTPVHSLKIFLALFVPNQDGGGHEEKII